jgi:hypothetical protein
MNTRLAAKIKPASGFSHILYIGLQILLPILIFVLVRINFPIQIALAVILLSKWRMFVVRPRYWLTNILANAVDIMVGVSILVFMTHSDTQMWQVIWAFVYALWLIFLKPNSSMLAVSLQAGVGQLAGLMALYLAWGERSLGILVIMTGLICFVSARHFLTSFDEPFSKLYAATWGYFGSALAWLLGHWLLFYYGVLAQPTLLLTVIGYGLAAMYYLEQAIGLF